MLLSLLETTTPGDAAMSLNMDNYYTKIMLAPYTSKVKDYVSCFVIVLPTTPHLFRKEHKGSVS